MIRVGRASATGGADALGGWTGAVRGQPMLAAAPNAMARPSQVDGRRDARRAAALTRRHLPAALGTRVEMKGNCMAAR
jgi:hypothetical protein